MVKIACGMNTFLEKENLKETLPHLRGFDAVIAVDGRHTKFEYPSRYSDDGSQQVLKRYKNVILLKKAGTQIIKRNTYLEYADILHYDFLLMVDADFDVEVDWKVFREELKRIKGDSHIAYNVLFWDSSASIQYALLYKPERVRYYELHNILRCRRCHFEIDITDRHTDNIKGIEIRHRNTKSEIHKLGKKAYRAWKLPHENRLRAKRGMYMMRGNQV